MIYDGQMITGDERGPNFPFVLQLKKAPGKKTSTQEADSGPLGGRQRRYPNTIEVVEHLEMDALINTD